MPTTEVRCCKCGKPLEKIPTYLGDGDGAKLFECDNCFYPGCDTSHRPTGREVGFGRGRLEAIVEDIARVLEPVAR